MLQLHFLFGDSLHCDPSLKEDRMGLERLAREHLGVEDTDRYSIQLLPDEQDPLLIHVLVEDVVSQDRYVDMEQFPSWVSPDLPRRTVWLNPPSIEEKVGTERSCPWNTHYTEYYQIYHANYNQNNLYTIKYWKQFEDIEMYHPTSLALARYQYLREKKEEEERDRLHWDREEEEDEKEQEEDEFILNNKSFAVHRT